MDIYKETKRINLRTEFYCEFSERVSKAIYDLYHPNDGTIIPIDDDSSDISILIQSEITEAFHDLKAQYGYYPWNKTKTVDVVWDESRQRVIGLTV